MIDKLLHGRLWHKAELYPVAPNVCCWGRGGLSLLSRRWPVVEMLADRGAICIA